MASTGSVFIEESSLEISKVGQKTVAPANQNADWRVNVTLAVRSVVASESATLTIDIPELNITSRPLKVAAIPANTKAPTFITVQFTVPNGVPELWFPHTLGTPRLYDFNIALTLSSSSTAGASFTTRSGFRTIELAQTPYSQEEVDSRGITPGDQWHFKVNGKTFYTLGTSIIPFDPFYARVDTAKARWVLESAVRTGQNMVCPFVCILLPCVAALTHLFH